MTPAIQLAVDEMAATTKPRMRGVVAAEPRAAVTRAGEQVAISVVPAATGVEKGVGRTSPRILGKLTLLAIQDVIGRDDKDVARNYNMYDTILYVFNSHYSSIVHTTVHYSTLPHLIAATALRPHAAESSKIHDTFGKEPANSRVHLFASRGRHTLCWNQYIHSYCVEASAILGTGVPMVLDVHVLRFMAHQAPGEGKR